MAVIVGTVTGVQLLSGNPNGVGNQKSYLCSVSFPAYTGSADTFSITGVSAAISAKARDGKTRAMIAGVVPMRAHPGTDAAGQAVYLGTLTISTDALTGSLTDSAQVELTATTGVSMRANLCTTTGSTTIRLTITCLCTTTGCTTTARTRSTESAARIGKTAERVTKASVLRTGAR